MKYKQKPFIIPVFIPHSGCPHQCAFCNQKVIAGQGTKKVSIRTARQCITQFLKYKSESRRPVQISFYGGNFLGLEPEDIQALLDEACRFIDQGKVDSIRFSTRPDTISPETLALIHGYPVKTIEIGVQSMDDSVLRKSRRGHTATDTEKALHLLQNGPYEIGLQMMVGLPGDDEASSWSTARKLAGFSPDFIRIYPALVLKDSLLARWYQAGKYCPMSLDDAVNRVKAFYRFFQHKGIPVIRMGLQASTTLETDQNILAGPYHPAFGHLVLSSIYLDRASELLQRMEGSARKIAFFVQAKNISKLRGQNNANIKAIKRIFQLDSIDVMPDESLPDDAIRVVNQDYPASFSS